MIKRILLAPFKFVILLAALIIVGIPMAFIMSFQESTSKMSDEELLKGWSKEDEEWSDIDV